VNLSIDVLDGMVNDLMRVTASQSLIGQELIGVECRASLDMFMHFSLERVLASVTNDLRVNIPAAL
jgi:hypothetical protein